MRDVRVMWRNIENSGVFAMTLCIAHRDGWVAADTRSTAGNEMSPYLIEPIIKVKKIPGVAVIGCAGDTGVYQRLDKSVWHAKEHDVVRELADALKSTGMDAQLLVVTKSADLVFITNNGVAFPLCGSQKWWAIGSGRDFAKGWFSAYEANGWPIQREAAFTCIAQSARFDTCINADRAVYEDLRV